MSLLGLQSGTQAAARRVFTAHRGHVSRAVFRRVVVGANNATTGNVTRSESTWTVRMMRATARQDGDESTTTAPHTGRERRIYLLAEDLPGVRIRPNKDRIEDDGVTWQIREAHLLGGDAIWSCHVVLV